ncbi:bank1 [Pungitius sinensis]
MNQTAEQLLIIYEKESEQWATYLHSVFSGPIPEARICRYDVATLSSRQDDFLWLVRYTCKLLILSDGMLKGLCPKRRFFLARVLRPAAHVVVLLCGVESLTPLLELVPLNANECLQVSSEQDAHEYLTTVNDILRKAAKANPLTHQPSGLKVEEMQRSVKPSMAVVPSRVPCRSSTKVFILLKSESAGSDAEVEFAGEDRMLRVKPECWNERILCVNAPDFTAGKVTVTLYSRGRALSKAQLQYYSNVEEITSLLARAADPVDFMCQALQESTLENLDKKLSSMLLAGMPSGGFHGLHCEKTTRKELHNADAPSLLHFAARHGFRSVSCVLLQCPGVERALHTANRHGQTPTEIAKSQGHTELHTLLKEALNVFGTGGDNDAGVYEMMGSAGTPTAAHLRRGRRGEHEEGEDEGVYAQLGAENVYDTIHNPTKAAPTASRPPAPTPRPEITHAEEEVEDGTPYITKVFQKKTPQRDADLYSVTTKQIQGRVNTPPSSSTYDTFVPNRTSGLLQLIELQQRVKAGSLSVDGAVGHFGEWQRAQKAMDAGQKEKSSQQRARFVGSAVYDDSVFDKINIVHLGPSVEGNEGRRGSEANESDGFSKPLKGQR